LANLSTVFLARFKVSLENLKSIFNLMIVFYTICRVEIQWIESLVSRGMIFIIIFNVEQNYSIGTSDQNARVSLKLCAYGL